MPAEHATALVLRCVDFSESSLVVTLFTREFGKIEALAKGAKRLKNPFDSALDLMSLCRIVFLRKSSEALDLVTEAKLLRRFRCPGWDLAPLYAGYYVVELLRDLTARYDPLPELFDLADSALQGLSLGEPVWRWVFRWELGALRLLGHLPSWESCVICGKPIQGSLRVAFRAVEGGVVCQPCQKAHPAPAPTLMVDQGLLRSMAVLAEPAHPAADRLEMDPVHRTQLRHLLDLVIGTLLGRQPRMHPYLPGLMQEPQRRKTPAPSPERHLPVAPAGPPPAASGPKPPEDEKPSS
ncbi:MAG: DNA repair protein RecO [Thermoguttaceae bacterium]|nr:DNA repair protein RecO [Thermoguttaceae bacterium]MDW8036654.1 DNA repair protein RecO [Thermoguttaceae bacterium]